MGIESQVVEMEGILEKDRCPYTKSCLTINRKDFDEKIHVCIKNYDTCPTYQTRQDNERRDD